MLKIHMDHDVRTTRCTTPHGVRRTWPDAKTMKWIWICLVALAVSGPTAARAQNTQLISLLANDWRYTDTAPPGRFADRSWTQPAYNDSDPLAGWRTGAALFGRDTAGIYDGPGSPFQGGLNGFQTGLDQAGGRMTFYFRKSFEFTEFTPDGVVLWVTNYLDDGAVYYLNGMELGRVRLPPWPTLISEGTPATEAPETGPDVLQICDPPLFYGDNWLAVEVHQSAPSSPDVAFALSLHVAAPAPPTLSSHEPGDRVVVEGLSTTLTVMPAGVNSALTFQWYFNPASGAAFEPIGGAVGSSHTIPAMTPRFSGRYYCQVRNCIGEVQSRVAGVTHVAEPVSLVLRVRARSLGMLDLEWSGMVPGWQCTLLTADLPGAGRWEPFLTPPAGQTNLSIPLTTASGRFFRIQANPVE